MKTVDEIKQAGQQIAQEADLRREGSRTPQTRARAAVSRDEQEGTEAAETDARTTTNATATTMATEEDNQRRMSTRFTMRSRKRANGSEEEEGATKKAGVGSPPKDGVGRRAPRSILRAQRTPRTTTPAEKRKQKGATSTPRSEGLRPKSSARKERPTAQTSGGERNVGWKTAANEEPSTKARRRYDPWIVSG